MLSTSTASPRLSLPHLNNLGGQVEFIGAWAPGLSSKKHLPTIKAESVGNSLDLACGGGASAFKDIAEACELHA